jgi:hypothetical protein
MTSSGNEERLFYALISSFLPFTNSGLQFIKSILIYKQAILYLVRKTVLIKYYDITKKTI